MAGRNPFGVRIHCVPVGFEVSDEAGQTLEVTDDSAVFRGSECFITQRNYDALKLKTTTHKEPV